MRLARATPQYYLISIVLLTYYIEFFGGVLFFVVIFFFFFFFFFFVFFCFFFGACASFFLGVYYHITLQVKMHFQKTAGSVYKHLFYCIATCIDIELLKYMIRSEEQSLDIAHAHLVFHCY